MKNKELLDEFIRGYLKSLEKLVYTDMKTFSGEVKRQVHALEKEKNHPYVKELIHRHGKKKINQILTQYYEDMLSDLLENTVKQNVKYLKKKACQFVNSNYRNDENMQYGEIVRIFWLVNDPVHAERLSAFDRVVIKGTCMEFLSEVQINNILALMDYQRGITAQDHKRLKKRECSDEYFIYSRKHKKAYSTLQIEGDSFWSLLINMLPVPILESIEKHPKANKYLTVSKYEGSSYNKRMSAERKDVEFLVMLMNYKTYTSLGFCTRKEFFREMADRGEEVDLELEDNAIKIEKAMSKRKTKYKI